jgi:soluble lytic murein transglycosylase
VKSRARLVLIIIAALSVLFLADQWRRMHLESSQDNNILAASRKHGVDPALVKAVVWQESRFNPRARGSKAELGLMQIMENTGREWAGEQRVLSFSEETLLNPVENIDCGTWYLGKLLRRYRKTDNPVPYALADYNAGRGNVLKWIKNDAATNSTVFIEQIRFPSTREYVRNVISRREKYVGEFDKSK